MSEQSQLGDDHQKPYASKILLAYDSQYNRFSLKFDVSDDDSGVDTVSYSLVNPANPDIFLSGNSAAYNSSTGLYESEYDLPSQAPNATWTLGNLWITDKSGNSQIYDSYSQQRIQDISTDGSLTVTRESPGDSTRPYASEIFLDYNDQSKAFTLKFEALDNESGIASVSYSLANPQDPDTYLSNPAAYNPISGLYENEYAVPDEAPNATWSLVNLWVTDNGGNSKIYDQNELKSVPTQGSLTVKKASAGDTIRPYANRVLLGYNRKSNKLTLKFAVSDDDSGVDTVTYSVVNPANPDIFLSETTTYNPLTGLYEGEYSLPDQVSNSTWTLVNLWITDKGGNNKIYDQKEVQTIPTEGSLSIYNKEQSITNAPSYGGGSSINQSNANILNTDESAIPDPRILSKPIRNREFTSDTNI